MTETNTETPIDGAESQFEPLSKEFGTSVPDERENGSEAKPSNREARYRVERNEARAERDALAERIERMQTRELERIAGEQISNPADLLALSGRSLADFIGEDGELEAEAVTVAATELLSTRPGLRKLTPGYDPTQGYGGNRRPKRELSWGALLGD